MATSIIAYLENYVESTLGLPSDLSRYLNTIKVLDERAAELMDAIHSTTEALCALPPVGTCRGTPQEQDFAELTSTFKRQEALLYQFSEEKVQLAQHALELITNYQKDLDATTQQFEEEVANVSQPAADAYNPFEQPFAAPGGRGGKGKGVTDQWDSLEPLAAPSLTKRGGGGGLPSHTSVGAAGPGSLGGGGPGGPVGGGGTSHKRRVRDDPRGGMTAAVLSAGDDFGSMGAFGGGGGVSSNPSSLAAGGEGMYPPLTFMSHARTAGLMDSAQQPQLPGRLLQLADIKPDLQGRQAEMYWPDDNMWYLIEIHRVNVVDRTATIVYRTGEVEELNLQEIANEGHMSLIEPM